MATILTSDAVRPVMIGLSMIVAFALGSLVWQRTARGLVLPIGHGFLDLEVRAPNIVRVAYSLDKSSFEKPSFAGIPPSGAPTPWRVERDRQLLVLTTSAIKVKVWLAFGTVSFFDLHDKPILVERDKKLEPTTVQGELTYHAQQTWRSNPNESLYGLGQHQIGALDIKGYDLDLWQRNTNVVVPF